MLYMLDANTASYVIKGNPPEVRRRLISLPTKSIVVSAVTQGELLYGSAHKGHPKAFVELIRAFLQIVSVLPWDIEAATVYGDLRAACSASGIALGALDMMIAAHAVASKAILVTHDKAFTHVPGDVLTIEDWVRKT